MSVCTPPREELIREINQLRERIAELEASQAEHSKAQLDLSRREERYASLVEQTRDGICILQNALVCYANSPLARMWGGATEDIVGTHFTDCVPSSALNSVLDRYERYTAGEDIEPRCETVLTRRDGAKVHVELRASRIADNGHPAHMLMVSDITERRRMEEWARWRDRLAAIGQQVAGIAHEINGALTGIIGFMQLAYTHEDVPEEPRADLEEAMSLARRMDRFTRHILDLSRHRLPEKRLLDVSQLLRDVAEFLDRTLPMTIRIVLKTTPDDFLINGDPVQMQQALTNLALNARDAMTSADGNGAGEGGEMNFELSCTTLRRNDSRLPPDKDPGKWIVLSVSDTGVGIPPEVLPHIYEPFFTTKDLGKGTGLGLAQVLDTVENHGGFIEVDTEVGRGTTFTLYLPPIP